MFVPFLLRIGLPFDEGCVRSSPCGYKYLQFTHVYLLIKRGMADIIMLAERPTNTSARGIEAVPSAASFSAYSDAGAAPQAIANYKGVMLCNRPGVVAEIPEWVKPMRDGLPVFRGGIPHETVDPRGRDRCMGDKPVKVKPHKKRHDAIEAHRKWLATLVQRREALQVSSAYAYLVCHQQQLPSLLPLI